MTLRNSDIENHRANVESYLGGFNLEEALKELNLALVKSNDTGLLFRRALIYLFFEKFQEARMDLLEIKKSPSFNHESQKNTDMSFKEAVLLALGNCYEHLQNYEEGRACAEELIEAGSQMGYFLRAKFLIVENRLSDAMRNLDEALKMPNADKFKWLICCDMAFYCMLNQQYDNALENFVIALSTMNGGKKTYAQINIAYPSSLPIKETNKFLDRFKKTLDHLTKKSEEKYDLSAIRRGDLFRCIQYLPRQDQIAILKACLNPETPLGARFQADHIYDTEIFADKIEAELIRLDPTFVPNQHEKKKVGLVGVVLGIFNPKQKSDVSQADKNTSHAVNKR